MTPDEPLPSPLNERLAAQVAEKFGAFPDTSRVEISESAISHPMRGLRQVRIVQARREGQRDLLRRH